MGGTPGSVNVVNAKPAEVGKIRRRGRSITVRNPEDSTNAAYNIHRGHYNTTRSQCPQKLRVENQDDCLSVDATITLADPFAFLGSAAILLTASFALLMFAVAISLLLEDISDDETGM